VSNIKHIPLQNDFFIESFKNVGGTEYRLGFKSRSGRSTIPISAATFTELSDDYPYLEGKSRIGYRIVDMLEKAKTKRFSPNNP